MIQKEKILKFLENKITDKCELNSIGVLKSKNYNWTIIVQNNSMLFKSGLRKPIQFKYDDVTCFEQITILANIDSNNHNRRDNAITN